MGLALGPQLPPQDVDSVTRISAAAHNLMCHNSAIGISFHHDDGVAWPALIAARSACTHSRWS